MINIHFLKDNNGNKQVINVLSDIAMKGKLDEGYANLTKYIAQALDYLQTIGVPKKSPKTLPFETTLADGRQLTFATILKELRHHPPLLEFRINWRGTGAFRAIFFYIDNGSTQDIYFTKATLKQEKNPPEFTLLARESEQMMRDFIKNKKGVLDND